MKKLLFVMFSLVLAVVIQQAAGIGLLILSELSPRSEPSTLSTAAFWLMPLPYLMGIYFLPFTTAAVYIALKRVMRCFVKFRGAECHGSKA